VTRAAAGYNRQATDIVSPSRPKLRLPPSTTDIHTNEGEDGLEAPKSLPIAHQIPRPVPKSPGMTAPRGAEFHKPLLVVPYGPTETPQAGKSLTTGDIDISDGEEMDFVTRLKKRQAERRRGREQRKSTNSKVKSDSGDILPDF
jgi:hypothetical protein